MMKQIPKLSAVRAVIGLILVGWLVIPGLGCRMLAGKAAGPFSGPSDLVATMPDPYNIHLRWKNHATAAGGNMVEFQLYPQGATLPPDELTNLLILGFLDAHENTFRHENIESETVFIYRIHPYFGNSTEPVDIMTGSAAAAANEPEEPEGPLEDPEKNPKDGSSLRSIRATESFAAAAPSDLTLSLSSATHVVLRWQDHARDADGYLVEVSQSRDRDFHVCALLPPHATSFKKTGLPAETKIYFRVRAFFYGRPSNRVTKTTGPELFNGVSAPPLERAVNPKP